MTTAVSRWRTGAPRSRSNRGCGCPCCRGSCLATAVFPTGPQSCLLVTEYLFSPEAVADPDFDPSPVISFNELVIQQDNDACERVQRGVRSRAFDHGVFPAKDAWVHEFDQRYLRDVESA